jgi:hypothetical protein
MSEFERTDHTAPALYAELPHEAAPQRPAFIPEKFWDAAAGRVRWEDLAKSYRALERRLGRGAPQEAAPSPTAEDHLREAMAPEHDRLGIEAMPPDGADGPREDGIVEEGVPEDGTPEDGTKAVPASPADYAVRVSHPWLERDADLDGMMHAAGFNHGQAQLVYDLAAERVVPVVEAMAKEFERRLAEAKLEAHFGGPERYATLARQVRAWGERNLPRALFEQLAASPDGIVALHQMMRAGEPRFISGDAPQAGPNQGELDAMVRDPRYWRDHDPQLVRRIEDGFRRLYPGT